MDGVEFPEERDLVVAQMLAPIQEVHQQHGDDESSPTRPLADRGYGQKGEILSVEPRQQLDIGDHHQRLQHCFIEEPNDVMGQARTENFLFWPGWR